MNEKTIVQAMREQADNIEKLAQRIVRESQALSCADDREIGMKVSNAEVEIQTKLRYEYACMAQAAQKKKKK